MGSSSVLGLLFEISADPSKAESALRSFEEATGTSFAATVAATKPFNDSLLTSRESARLLTEELGIHQSIPSDPVAGDERSVMKGSDPRADRDGSQQLRS